MSRREEELEKALLRVSEEIRKVKDFISRNEFYHRRHLRQEVCFPIEVKVLDPQGKTLDEGGALVLNLSPEGFFVTELRLAKQVLPLTAFEVAFLCQADPLRGLAGRFVPVYFSFQQGEVGIGARFTFLGENERTLLAQYLSPEGGKG